MKITPKFEASKFDLDFINLHMCSVSVIGDVMLSRLLIKPHAKNTSGRVEVYLHTFLSMALVSFRSCPLYTGKGNAGTSRV
jgi:hypothetical protein